MSRRGAAILIGSISILALLSLGWLLLRKPGRTAPGGERADEGTPEMDGPTISARVFYPGSGGWLVAEEVELPSYPSAEEKIRILLTILLGGSETPGLQSPFPVDVELRDVHISAQGVAYVDFATPDQRPPPAGGSRQELLIVYSVVNTVLLNLPEVRAVTLLWNGQQRESFSGHLDMTRPLRANKTLVAQSP